MTSLRDSLRKNIPELLALCTGGLPGFLFHPRPAPTLPGLPVFCDHIVPPNDYEKRLRFLCENHYLTLTADEAAHRIRGNTPFTGHEVVLTVDDGAVQFYRELFPLLCKYQCKAILFVCPGLHEETPNTRFPENRLCTWRELSEMQNSGWVDIQCHTLQHRSIPSWPRPLPLTGVAPESISAYSHPAPISLEADLREARRLLQERLNSERLHLAWPQYNATPEAHQIARSLGYRFFWTGTRPAHAWNSTNAASDTFVRLSGEFITRLPGENRQDLKTILLTRYRKALRA